METLPAEIIAVIYIDNLGAVMLGRTCQRHYSIIHSVNHKIKIRCEQQIGIGEFFGTPWATYAKYCSIKTAADFGICETIIATQWQCLQILRRVCGIGDSCQSITSETIKAVVSLVNNNWVAMPPSSVMILYGRLKTINWNDQQSKNMLTPCVSRFYILLGKPETPWM